MERLVELEEIVLLPTEKNLGRVSKDKIVMTVRDSLDRYSESLPVFTLPLDSIVGESNIKTFMSNGVRPILPLTDDLKTRIKYCIGIFCSFSIDEIKKEFIDKNNFYRGNQYQYHICIETGNGHENDIFSTCMTLKKIYGPQIIVMGGNLLCPETYSDYSKSYFDYVRVGSSSSTSIVKERFGFHYPLASLLEGIKQYRKTSGIGLSKQVKIVADGGITTSTDIIKAIALGADYVMLGKTFAHCVEANGQVIQKIKHIDGRHEEVKIFPESLVGVNGERAELNGYFRRYSGNTHPDICSVLAGFPTTDDWINCKKKSKFVESLVLSVDKSLPEWKEDLERSIYYAFMMTSSTNWEEFKTRVRYGRVSL